MYDVRISDSLYEQASLAAQAHHVTVEAFVEKAVQQSLQEETLDAAIQTMFTPELLAKIDAAGVDVAAGNHVTLEQLDARLAATRVEWQIVNPS